MIKEKKGFVDNGYWGYYFRQKNLPLVVVFGFRDLDKGKFPHFSYFRNSECNVLFLNSHENNWYQNGIEGLGDSHNETIESLRDIIEKFEPSLTTFFGFSMGAYGAILYSCFLKPTKVVALSPELDLKLEHSRSLENLGQKTLLGENLAELLLENSISDIHILCGDMEPIDLYFYAKYKNIINGEITFIKGCAHYVTIFLSHEKEFDSLISSLSQNKRYELPSKYKVEHKKELSFEDADIFFTSVNLHKNKEFQDSIELFFRIEESFKEWAPFWWHYGRSYLKVKDYNKAKVCFENALNIQDDNGYFLFDLANTFRLDKNKEKAIEILSSIIQKPFVGKRAEKLIAKIKG